MLKLFVSMGSASFCHQLIAGSLKRQEKLTHELTLGECLDIFALINKGFLCTNVHGLLDHFGNLCTKAIFGIFVTEVSIGKEESIRAKTEPIFLPVRLEERRH